MISRRAFAGLLCTVLLLAACAARPERPLESAGDIGGLRNAALSLVNEERARRGLPRLSMTGPLNAAAQAHAEDMARRDYYAHRSPEGRDVADRYRAHGGGWWQVIGENIASCIACRPPAEQLAAFQGGWMQSPGHRANILNPQVEEFGFGMAAAGGRLYAVQAFLRKREDGFGYTMPPPEPLAAGRSAATFAR